MKLPSMKYASGIVKGKQIRFGGLNHSRGAGDGEIWKMRNMTSDHYPILATRPPRLKYGELENPGGIFSWDGLAWVDGETFYFDGEARGNVTAGEKTFACMGAYIVIFPDKYCYNVDTREFLPMESCWEGESLTIGDGMLYGEAAEDNMIQADGVAWSDYFRVGDAVTISGCAASGNNGSKIIRDIDGDKMYFYEYSFTNATEEATYQEAGTLSISRTVPDLQFLCENENRLWGCMDNTIYACKLGDIFNWNVYDGLDTDAYAVDTGSAGAFTGCVSYLGYPTFFKEDNIYKVYGSVPSNFEVMGSATLGLAAGCEKSLAIAGETLFYLSRNGVMAYTGGIPQPVNAAFGIDRYRNGVGGSDGLKYYISMEAADGTWGLYVYDTQLGLWHQEDCTHAIGFAKWSGNLYCLNDAGEIWITGNVQDPPEGCEEETDICWEVEFTDFTEEDPNKKGVSKLQIRLELGYMASMETWLQFDSDGEWVRVNGILHGDEKRSYYLPIIPRRSDHYRLKLSGVGECRIYSLVREYYTGSELKSKQGRN